MKKKGFTLIELLVVIAIIAMLLAILMPALNKVKKIAQRVVCGTNLKGLGTALIVYANDYEDDFVIQGAGYDHPWDYTTYGWQATTAPWASADRITIGASLYLLVREADVSPKSFVCGGSGQQEFDGENANQLDIVELWDFGHTNDGNGPRGCVSYAYHAPYDEDGKGSSKAADGTKSASFAVMADKNPYCDPKITYVLGEVTEENWYEGVRKMGRYWDTDLSESDWTVKVANAYPHSRDGQNVLFGDGHTSYEKTTDVGVRHDALYLRHGGGGDIEDQIRRGDTGTLPEVSKLATIQPITSEDTYLVNDDHPDFD